MYNRNNTQGRKPSTKFQLRGVSIYIPEEFNDVADDVCNMVSNIPFNIISIPLNAKRGIMSTDDIDETRGNKCITIGFIKKYDPDQYTFDVVIFNQYKDIINNMDVVIIPEFGMYKGEVTKINRIRLDIDPEPAECAEEETEQ